MEENVNEILGIEQPKQETNSTLKIEMGTMGTMGTMVTDKASKGLSDAASVCNVLFCICLIIAIIAGFTFIWFIGSVDSYNDRKALEALQICAIASVCFSGGIAGAISCYVFSKLLGGMSVIAKASEQYINAQSLTSKSVVSTKTVKTVDTDVEDYDKGLDNVKAGDKVIRISDGKEMIVDEVGNGRFFCKTGSMSRYKWYSLHEVKTAQVK